MTTETKRPWSNGDWIVVWDEDFFTGEIISEPQYENDEHDRILLMGGETVISIEQSDDTLDVVKKANLRLLGASARLFELVARSQAQGHRDQCVSVTARGECNCGWVESDRSTRRRLGKSDPIDAEMAARAVLAGVAKDTPKSGLDNVEMIRMLKIVKDSAIKARTQAINQMKALMVTAPVELRHTLAELNVRRLVARCANFRPGKLVTPLAAAKHALRSLARRHDQLNSEIEVIGGELRRLTSETAPALVDVFGIGPDTAATLLITAGSNPERLRSEAAFAALCGVNPIPASSGKTNRHRLNRGGDRQANSALYRIVLLVRLGHHEPTQEYMSRRVGEGMTKSEVIRCLKRYVARQIYPILLETGGKNVAATAS